MFPIWPQVNECPSRKQLQLVEGKVEEEYKDAIEENSNEEEELEGDTADRIAYVIERILLAPRQSQHTQRHSTFKTRCTINNKVCD